MRKIALIITALCFANISWADIQQAQDAFQQSTEDTTVSYRETLHQEFLRNQERSMKEQLEDEHKNRQKAVENLEKQIVREKANVIRYRQEIPQMEEQILENKEEIAELRPQLPPLKDELDDIQDDLNDERDKLRDKEFELQSKQEDVTDKDRELQRIEDDIDDLNNRMDDPDSFFEDSVDSLNEAENRLDRVESRIDSDASRIRSHNNGQLPACVRRRMNSFDESCDASAFIQKKKKRIRKIDEKLSDPGVSDSKKNELRDEKRSLQELIRYTEHIIQLFDHRDHDLIPLKEQYELYEKVEDEKKRLQRDADRYERDVVDPIRQRVKKLEDRESNKLWEIRQLEGRIEGLEEDNRELRAGIKWKKRRIVELEGPNGDDGLIRQWEDVDLPQARVDEGVAKDLLDEHIPVFEAQEEAYKNAFNNVMKEQDIQEEAKTELYEAQAAEE